MPAHKISQKFRNSNRMQCSSYGHRIEENLVTLANKYTIIRLSFICSMRNKIAVVIVDLLSGLNGRPTLSAQKILN